MKSFSMVVLGLAAGLMMTSAQAQVGEAALPGSLASTMKQMSVKIKQVASQATDAAKNANSAQLSDEFAQLTTHARDFTPDSVAALPAAQREAAKAGYVKMIDETVGYGKALAQAFRDGDAAKAADLLRKLSSQKSEGHAQYK